MYLSLILNGIFVQVKKENSKDKKTIIGGSKLYFSIYYLFLKLRMFIIKDDKMKKIKGKEEKKKKMKKNKGQKCYIT